MLTSVLHTERAIVASIQIIEAFVEMTHLLQGSSSVLAELYDQAKRQNVLEEDVRAIKESMLVKADLPVFMQLFDRGLAEEEVLILDGEPLRADAAYQRLYRAAKQSIVVVDDYLGVKTLQHLAHAAEGVTITIVSDNRAHPPLTAGEYADFRTQKPELEVRFIRANDRCHDRFIALDLGTSDARVFLCGASSKDAGKRITTIVGIANPRPFETLIGELLEAGELELR